MMTATTGDKEDKKAMVDDQAKRRQWQTTHESQGPTGTTDSRTGTGTTNSKTTGNSEDLVGSMDSGDSDDSGAETAGSGSENPEKEAADTGNTRGVGGWVMNCSVRTLQAKWRSLWRPGRSSRSGRATIMC